MPAVPPSSSPEVEELLKHARGLKWDGHYEQALKVLERALSAEPTNVEVLEEIADCELSVDHDERSLAAAKRAVSLDENSAIGHYILGFLASKSEQWPKAVSELTLSNDLQPNDPEILRCLGWALFSSGKTAEGLVTLERALNLESGNPLTLCDLGVAYLKLKDFMKSKALFQRAVDIDPENPRAKDCLEMVKKVEERTRGA